MNQNTFEQMGESMKQAFEKGLHDISEQWQHQSQQWGKNIHQMMNKQQAVWRHAAEQWQQVHCDLWLEAGNLWREKADPRHFRRPEDLSDAHTSIMQGMLDMGQKYTDELSEMTGLWQKAVDMCWHDHSEQATAKK